MKFSNCLNPYYNGKYSMRQVTNVFRIWKPFCLNPYYNGKYSMSGGYYCKEVEKKGLNPYYNGKYSMSSSWSS